MVVLGEMGIGNTTVAAALAAGLTGGDAKTWVGRGTGVDGPALKAKQDVVSRALERVGTTRSPRELLQCLGGREIAAMVGAMLAAAREVQGHSGGRVHRHGGGTVRDSDSSPAYDPR